MTVNQNADPTPDPYENPAVAEKIEEHLAAFEALDPDDTGVVEEGVSQDAPAVEGQDAPAVEQPTTEEPVAGTEPVGAVDTSKVPDAYRRSAYARGWTPEDVDTFVTANPDLAMRTLERIHSSRIAEINEWADHGRKQSGANVEPEAPASAPDPLQGIDLDALLADPGSDEDLIRRLVEPVNAAFEHLRPLVQQAQIARQTAEQAAQTKTLELIEQFFGSPELAPYKDLYGDSWGPQDSPTQQARQKVLETADALLAGSRAQGRDLGIDEALLLAHDAVSGSYKEHAIRDKMKAAVTRRAASVTLVPRSVGEAGGGASLEDKTQARLAEVFGR